MRVLSRRGARVPALQVGLLLFGGMLAVALVSRVWTPEVPGRMRIALRLRPPGVAALAGTDALGRDILSQLMVGASTSLTIAGLAVASGLLLGAGLGLLAAARRGWVDEVVVKVSDVLFAFPAPVSAIVLAAALGPGLGTAVLAIGLFAVPVFVRVTRAAALRVWVLDYCLAAQAAGMGRGGVTLAHVLPNIVGTLAVQASLQLGLAILVEAGLAFLGLSVPPPTPSWGRMLFDSQTYLGQAPWMAVAPGLAIALTVLGLNLLGDGLRDRFDPRGPA